MEQKFTPPASGATRLSEDVWALICTHAAKNGNSSTREAIEQLVRRTLGSAQVVQLGGIEAEPTATMPPTPPLNNPSPEQPQTAAAALDAVLLN